MSKMVIASLSSVSPYSQSNKVREPELPNESKAEHDTRTWRQRCHWTDDGKLFIPPTAFKNSLSEAAKFLSMQIEGKGKQTYTKHFEAGVLVADPLILPQVTKDNVKHEVLFVPSDGVRGSGKRVDRTFPLIENWSGKVTFYVLDDVITEAAFRKHLETAGSLIGIGRFRPRNNGYYGRFKVESLTWGELS